jgi:hypothetical protein
MSPRAVLKRSKDFDLRCADLLALAEQELSAFFSAVKRSFGSKQAERSANDWLHELIENEGLPTSPREWRSITTKVMVRLASQVSMPSLSAEFTNA